MKVHFPEWYLKKYPQQRHRDFQRALLIDDSKTLSEKISSHFSAAKCQLAAVASDMGEALFKISTQPIDLVFIHISPGSKLAPLQIARVIKQEDLPFYFLCSSQPYEGKKWAMDLNPDGYLDLSNDLKNCGKKLSRLIGEA